MKETGNRLVRTASVCIIIAFLTATIYLGSDIISPLVMALFFAVLLRPVVSFLNARLRIPHILAVFLTVLVAVGIAMGVIAFMSFQISEFMSDIPSIKQKLEKQLIQIQSWIENASGLSLSQQKNYVQEAFSISDVISASSFGSITNGLLYTTLIPIYTFLILLYRSLLLGFLLKLVPPAKIASLQIIILDIKTVIRSYIAGLLIEVVIVALMTAFGLWLIGSNYFIFLGILTAFLNLIPYIGILIACTISILIAIIDTSGTSAIFGVIIVNAIVQFIDNNILIPRIVGSKVSINALASMVGVIIGGSLAGITGMFLAIPVIAVMKVVFDNTPSLSAYGYLMGDDVPKAFNWRYIRLLNGGNETTVKKDNPNK